MAFYELRQYKVKPGKLAEWVKIMEEEIIPFQVSRAWLSAAASRVKKTSPYMSGCAVSKASNEKSSMQRFMRPTIGRTRWDRAYRIISCAKRTLSQG